MLLYRATSIAEYDDLMAHEMFRTADNTLEGKQFFKSRQAVDSFVRIAAERRYRPPYRYLVRVFIEDDLFDNLVHGDLILDGFEAISIHEEHLTDFNNIVALRYMVNTDITYDLTAKIFLLPTEIGGRKKPVATGYRPSFTFNSINHFTGEIRLVKTKELWPGQSSIAVIKLLPARHLRKNLKPNDTFSINEGTKTVGTGVIEKVKIVK
jgi:hypothetical protein